MGNDELEESGWQRLRSSKYFIYTVVNIAIFTDSYLYGTVSAYQKRLKRVLANASHARSYHARTTLPESHTSRKTTYNNGSVSLSAHTVPVSWSDRLSWDTSLTVVPRGEYHISWA